MNKLKKIVLYLWNSRGFHPARILFTVFYASLTAYCGMHFTRSVGNYTVQVFSFIGLVGGIILFIRSIKRLIDLEVRNKIKYFVQRVSQRISGRVNHFFKGIAHRLGIDKWRKYGESREFIFRDRKNGSKRFAKLINPNLWQDMEDNSQRVRYIFTDYMIKKIKEGYKLKPNRTPAEMKQDLVQEENEDLLFETYIGARYSGGRYEIDDKTVDLLTDEFKEKKRRR